VGAVAVVVAAGSGTRLPGSVEKQFAPLRGRPVVVRALEALAAAREVEAIVLVVPRGREEFARAEMVIAHRVPRVAAVVAGGATRGASVRLGLAAVPASTDWVIVHDAARPLATAALVGRVLEGARETGAAVPAMPVADTLKRADGGVVIDTLDRDGLWAVQTPQAFGQRTLLAAHARAEKEGWETTDDAALVERAGGRVRIVEGERWNIKITEAGDLVVAEAILEARERAGPGGASEGPAGARRGRRPAPGRKA
jgi:2-C-methyl-D-erythritol 4-phosphate cytidylyltransferase